MLRLLGSAANNYNIATDRLSLNAVRLQQCGAVLEELGSDNFVRDRTDCVALVKPVLFY